MLPRLDGRLLDAIRSIEAVFRKLNLTSVIIGGVAVSLLATPRATEDVDALIMFDVADRSALLASLEQQGFHPQFDGMDDFIVQARLVTVVHVATGTIVDIMLGCMPFEEEIILRSDISSDGDVVVRLPSPEDLIILKAIASRPKDMEDIRNIALTYPSMDHARIEHWVRQYGELLEQPDLWDLTRALLDTKA